MREEEGGMVGGAGRVRLGIVLWALATLGLLVADASASQEKEPAPSPLQEQVDPAAGSEETDPPPAKQETPQESGEEQTPEAAAEESPPDADPGTSDGEGAAAEEAAPPGAGQPEARVADPPTDPPTGTNSPVAPSYSAPSQGESQLARWLGSGLAERVSLGKSRGGRDILAVQIGAPGPTPLAERATILLVGGLDGISVSGSQAVLAIADSLLANADKLPEGVTFLCVPWANPDGLARRLEGRASDGRNDRPIDDDRDGTVDEDGPDDLDGDGLVLEMLIEDPDGPWVRAEGGRFLHRARPGEAPRYLRVPEGRDDDGDGLYNEDPVGGVVLDRSFPVNWRGPWTGVRSGPSPLSEPAARALADLAISRRLAISLVFQGNHGLLATPGGMKPAGGVLSLPLPSDDPAYRTLVESFSKSTGRIQAEPFTLAELHDGDGESGAAVDWFYAALGSLSAEVAVWGPSVDRVAALDSRAFPKPGFTRRPAERGGAEPAEAAALEPDLEHAWASWLDEARGGLGFVEWQPVDLGGGRSALVGGWQPFTCVNPPPDLLPTAVAGLDRFVLDLAARLPRLEVEVIEERRSGRVAILRARVRNLGGLPSGVGPSGPRTDTRLRLELPSGVELLAGERELDLGHLPAQGSSATIDWLLMAPEDSVFSLVIESPWAAPLKKEIRL